MISFPFLTFPILGKSIGTVLNIFKRQISVNREVGSKPLKIKFKETQEALCGESKTTEDYHRLWLFILIHDYVFFHLCYLP